MFSFSISPDFRNEASSAIEKLTKACQEQSIEISRTSDFIYQADQQLARKAEIIALQIEMVKKLQKQEVKDLAAIYKEYHEGLQELRQQFIEIYEEQLNNKEKPYVFVDGEILQLTEPLRRKYVQSFSEKQLPEEMSSYHELNLNEQTDLNELIKSLGKKIDYCIQQAEFLKNLRIHSASPYMERQEAMSGELALAMARFKQAIASSLYGICLFGNLADLNKLIDKQSLFSRKSMVSQILDDEGNTALHLIAMRGESSMAERLLSLNGDLTCLNKYGYDPIHTAVRSHNITLLNIFLKKNEQGKYLNKFNLLQSGEYERTLLHTASFHGYLDVLKMLPEEVIAKLIDRKTKNDNQESTALHIAAERGFSSIVNWLLDKGASSNILNKNQETPLMTAIIVGQSIVANHFFQRGVWLSESQSQLLLTSESYHRLADKIYALIKAILQYGMMQCQSSFLQYNDITPNSKSSENETLNFKSTKTHILKAKLPNAAEINFAEADVDMKGDCGFIALGASREQVYHCLIKFSANNDKRKQLAEEIYQAFLTHEIFTVEYEQLSQNVVMLQENLSNHWRSMREQALDWKPALGQVQAEQEAALIKLLDQQNKRDIIESFNQKKTLLTQAEEKLKQYCQTEAVYALYVTGLRTKLWLGYHSALMYAEENHISLYIWRKQNENSHDLELINYYQSSKRGQIIHMLHTAGFTHFNLLLECPQPAMTQSYSVGRFFPPAATKESSVIINAEQKGLGLC
ncbi:MAG TPA: ankyrin repeat domain-containing protein [Gammaproteobacteria bacterium]|nr:ankyrin repeat domain-containing protein [Gammaproteobacteria bacterium]